MTEENERYQECLRLNWIEGPIGGYIFTERDPKRGIRETILDQDQKIVSEEYYDYDGQVQLRALDTKKERVLSTIFQRFDLDVEKLRREIKETTPTYDITSVARTLRSELISRGYSVLESNTMVAGLHSSVIVGGELGTMQHKQDFYEIAGRFNLPYSSGDCYFPHPES